MLNRLSRITTPGREFIPQIDGLRFVAIMAVLAFHTWSIGTFHLGHPGDTSNVVARFFNKGNEGVQLFFAISGFILLLPFAKQYLAGGKKINIREYFIRRVTRIEPPYVIQLVLVFLWTALVLRRSVVHQGIYGSEGWLKYTGVHMLTSLFYAHDLVYKSYPYPNIVLWSLEVEVQFYIVAPLLACLFAIRYAWMRRALIIGLILAWPELLSRPGVWSLAQRVGLIEELPNFLEGFLLVEFYLAGWLAPGRKNRLWDLVFLLCIPAMVFSQSLKPWIILLFCLGAFCGKFASWFTSNLWIITIGGMCYTIYMYHWLMMSLLIRGTIYLKTGMLWLDLLIQFMVLSSLIIFICAFLFAWFERPFMRRDWPARLRQWIIRGGGAQGIK